MKASLEILLEFKNIWETSFKECQEIRTKNSEFQLRIEKVEQENKRLNNKVNLLEDKLLEGNIIFQGIPESLWEPSATTKEKVLTAILHTISGSDQEDKMNQARGIPIKDVRCIGRYVAMKTYPVLVEFCHKADADYLLSNRSNLPRGVYIDKQYSEETERERCKLRPILRAVHQHEDFKGKCQMDGLNLVITGKNYSSKNLYQLPEAINGFNATCKQEGNVLGFFGELNPFSNFHPTLFNINGFMYHSSEQFIQHQKCLLFGDCVTEKLVLGAETALECKLVSKDVKNFDNKTWNENASCTPGILANLNSTQP